MNFDTIKEVVKCSAHFDGNEPRCGEVGKNKWAEKSGKKLKWSEKNQKSEPTLKWIFRVSRFGLIRKTEDYSRWNMNTSVKKNSSVGLQIDAPSASPSPIPPDRLDYDIDITNLPQWVYWPRLIDCSLFESQLISINISTSQRTFN